MKITFSNNINDIGCAIEANQDEVGGMKELKALANKFQGEMTRAYDAAQMIFKKFPEFRQVTFDTMTNEERSLIEIAKKSNNQN